MGKVATTRAQPFLRATSWTLEYEVDANGNLTLVRDAENQDEVILTYDGFDRLVEVTDRTGAVRKIRHDSASNVIRTERWGPTHEGTTASSLLAAAAKTAGPASPPVGTVNAMARKTARAAPEIAVRAPTAGCRPSRTIPSRIWSRWFRLPRGSS